MDRTNANICPGPPARPEAQRPAEGMDEGYRSSTTTPVPIVRPAMAEKDAFLAHGGIFILRDVETGKVLTMIDGMPRLVLDPSEGHKWKCAEKHGWFGFRNTVSGTFLHHRGPILMAQLYTLDGCASFVPIRDPRGGYVLRVQNAVTLELVSRKDDNLCLRVGDKGLLFEFRRIIG